MGRPGSGRVVKVGIIDHLDSDGRPLGDLLASRLRLIELIEREGYDGYHLAEHHATPLSYTPSPTVYLAAAARETSRIRLGALLFLLPLYNPLRLIEELCMVDHLSKGRLDIGVGRGISPHEFEALGVPFDDADADLLGAFAGLAALSLRNAEILRRPKSLAYLQGLKWVAQAKERVR